MKKTQKPKVIIANPEAIERCSRIFTEYAYKIFVEELQLVKLEDCFSDETISGK